MSRCVRPGIKFTPEYPFKPSCLLALNLKQNLRYQFCDLIAFSAAFNLKNYSYFLNILLAALKIQPFKSHSALKRVIYTMVASFISSHPCPLPFLSLLHHLCTFILFLSFLRLIKYLLFLGSGLFIFWSVFSAVAGSAQWLNSAVSDVLSVWLSSWGWRLG